MVQCRVVHDADNFSDHSLLLEIAVNFRYSEDVESTSFTQLKWSSASLDNLTNYKAVIDGHLHKVFVLMSAVSCIDPYCTVLTLNYIMMPF